ncbi:hypothetical protein RchiOBHm_Chr6g0270471 [Rosa chinensis]|uniref:Uncharacterized protein n=1 Tax=Rosa chinensis TaxID=74649 RepID=A0A2P6PQR5_ROSCH|nr:hypothetical protein RchiOBHm_Chr6g0270471 [Rosa chinensis]
MQPPVLSSFFFSRSSRLNFASSIYPAATHSLYFMITALSWAARSMSRSSCEPLYSATASCLSTRRRSSRFSALAFQDVADSAASFSESRALFTSSLASDSSPSSSMIRCFAASSSVTIGVKGLDLLLQRVPLLLQLGLLPVEILHLPGETADLLLQVRIFLAGINRVHVEKCQSIRISKVIGFLWRPCIP